MVKEKHVNLSVAAVLLCLDAVYLYTAFHGRQYQGSVVGPFEFAKYLGIALACLCGAVIVQTLRDRREDGRFEIKRLDLVCITLGGTALFLLLWQVTGLFYLWAFCYVEGLLLAFEGKQQDSAKKAVLGSTVIAAGVTLTVYLLFAVGMKIYL